MQALLIHGSAAQAAQAPQLAAACFPHGQPSPPQSGDTQACATAYFYYFLNAKTQMQKSKPVLLLVIGAAVPRSLALAARQQCARTRPAKAAAGGRLVRACYMGRGLCELR